MGAFTRYHGIDETGYYSWVDRVLGAEIITFRKMKCEKVVVFV